MNNILPFLCIFLVTFCGCNVIADDYSYDEFKQLVKDIIAEHRQNRQDVKNRKDANDVRCEAGWSEYDNNCYYYEDKQKKNWTEAQEYCFENDSELASVYSLDELKFMRNLSSQNSNIICGTNENTWIGGVRYGPRKDQTFRMIYDDTEIKEEFWAKGEPNDVDEDENCVELNCFSDHFGLSFRLNDHKCYVTYYYVCKKKLSENVPETTQSTQIQPDKDVACKADWAFMIDHSDSLTIEQFNQEKTFVLEIIKKLDPQPNGAHVSITFFAEFVSHSMKFSDTQDLSTASRVIKDFNCAPPGQPEDQNCVRNGSGLTKTHEALWSTNITVFDEKNGMRPSYIPKNIVIVTDGICNCGNLGERFELQKVAKSLKKRSIRVVAVGILQKGESEEDLTKTLRYMTSTPDDTHLVKDFEKLDRSLIERLSNCSDDCEYSQWTPWSPCTKGGYNRRRVIETECRGNGTPCDVDSLYEEKDCNDGKVQDCQADWAFVMDASYSMNDEEFLQEKTFALELIKELKPRRNGAHVAILIFARELKIYMYFNDPQNMQAIDEIFMRMNRSDINTSGTKIHRALKWARNFLFNETAGMRMSPLIPKNIVLITDGACGCDEETQLKPSVEATLARNIRIIAIGVGTYEVDSPEWWEEKLTLLGAKPDDRHIAREFTDLDVFVERVSYCSEDCVYGEWNDWSSCSTSCGLGRRNHSRKIEVVGRGDGIRCDEDEQHDLKYCDTGECPATTPVPFNSSDCYFPVRTYPHELFVPEGEPIYLICGHGSIIHDHDHIWTRCRWTRPSDDLSCTFTQTKNVTTNRFEIHKECPSFMTPKMLFAGSSKESFLKGKNFCGIRVWGASLNDSGPWGCALDYTGWMDYGVGDEWCTARTSSWLEVREIPLIILPIPQIRVHSPNSKVSCNCALPMVTALMFISLLLL